MIIRGRLTSIPNDLPVPDGTPVEVVRLNGGAVLATLSTSGGWYEWIVNGNPGRVQVRFTYDGRVKNQWSEITGPSNGVDVGSLWMAFNAFTSGRINNFAGNLAVTATGTGMTVTVAAGAALVKGQLYDRYTTGTVAIGASNTQPRKDLVVVRCWLNDSGDPNEGRTELLVLPGTPAATPVPPALLNTSLVFDLLLATVDVPANAAVISSGNVTTNAVYATPYIGPGSITGTELADGIVTTAKLAENSVTSSKILNGAITAADIADGVVTVGIYNDDGGSYVGQANRLDLAAPLAAADVGGAYRKRIAIANGGITEAMLAAAVTAKLNATYTGKPTLLPGTEYVATGPISSGSRTLNTLAVGPLLNGVQYDIVAEHGVSIRNQVNTGTVIVKVRIAGGAWRTHEFQNVGGVPRWAPVKQSATITGTGATIDVVSAIDYAAADPTDVRAGQVSVIAIPR